MIRLNWVDFKNSLDADAVTELTNAYAQDANAIGGPLPDDVLAHIAEFLSTHPAALGVIAYDEAKPVGLATCVLSLSTFAAKPILNIHDIVVLPENRGIGIGAMLMREVEAEARRRGCCKVSLEVADGNPARNLYEREGFVPSGTFMTKPL